MKNRFVLVLVSVFLCLCLSGCGRNNEYLVIEDYTPSVQEDSSLDGKTLIKNFAGLKKALLRMAYAGQTEGSLVFDTAYEGDIVEDMASACWAVRTQDALCAYCVENIAYELEKIVTINEASIYISFSDYTEKPENVHRLTFASSAERVLKSALSENQKSLVLLVDRSDYSAEDMADVITSIYREYPTIVPREPFVGVDMYSGNGSQRLYEININYGLDQEELDQRAAQLLAIDAFSQLDTENMSPAHLAFEACRYLMDNVTVSENAGDNTAYSALIGGAANSEGLAFAYVELCRQLGIDCRIVYGQQNWQEHSWNIVRIDGEFYHVDVSAAILAGPEQSFMCSDARFWGTYRWDVNSYPECKTDFDFTQLS